jgi:hypothetical protein
LRQEAELEQSYKSLQDYQKEKGEVKKAAGPGRVANEGADDKKWQKLTKIVKEEVVDEFFVGKVMSCRSR